MEGVLDHDVCSLSVGCGFVQPLELVECVLAERKDAGAQGEDSVDEPLYGFVQLITGNHAVDQAELEGSIRGNGLGGHQHFQSGTRRNHSDERNHWRCAEKADLDSRGGEGGLIRCHGQVAGRDELATRCRGQTMYPSNHRLLELTETEHHTTAQLEKLAVVVLRTADEFREIMPRGKDGAVAGENDGPG